MWMIDDVKIFCRYEVASGLSLPDLSSRDSIRRFG